MLEKLEKIDERFRELEALMSAPEVASDMQRMTALSKEYKHLEDLVRLYRAYLQVMDKWAQAKSLLQEDEDPSFKAAAQEEIALLEPQKEALLEQLKERLLFTDPHDKKAALLEIRAGTGGDEAALFAGDVFRMYARYAEKKGWRVGVIESTEGPAGGYKEVVAHVLGEGAYGLLKHESGVHRVQRVPSTETQGRVHTSAASVVVLPEIEEVEVALDMQDVRKDVYCSSGPGGQSVNTTYSAVRLTHTPTGIVVTCQDEKSQLKNLDKALKVLRARLYKLRMSEQEQAIGSTRKAAIGRGDRSDKIRTYNYPQGRITDHRINYTIYNLSGVMDGNLEVLIEQLRVADRAAQLIKR